MDFAILLEFDHLRDLVSPLLLGHAGRKVITRKRGVGIRADKSKLDLHILSFFAKSGLAPFRRARAAKQALKS